MIADRVTVCIPFLGRIYRLTNLVPNFFMEISLKYDNCVIKSLAGYSVKYYFSGDLGSLSCESACPSFGQSNEVTRPLSSVKDE